MSGVRITFAADLAETNAFFARAVAAGTNMRPLMAAIAATMAAATEEAFEDESDPSNGAKWPELSEVRKEQRKEHGTWPGKMLQEYGPLAASYLPSHGDTWAELGSVLEYAATQHFGRGKIPPRPHLGLGPDHEAEIILATATFFSSL
jgi:phage virion morphogenesis protein